MNHAFVEHLRRKIKEEVNHVAEHLATGRAASFEEYRHLTGIVHGLTFVEREINDLMDAFDKE
jgi:hypothetical protein